MKKAISLVLATLSLSVIATGPSFAQDWPMFQHDPRHTGYSTSTAPSTNYVLWSSEIEPFIFSSSVVADGKVFVGSRAFVGTNEEEARLYCLDACNGDVIWFYPIEDRIELGCSPAVADGRVFFASEYGPVYCLDASNGDLIWTYENEDTVWRSSPTVAHGKVFITDYAVQSKVYCLDASDGSEIWTSDELGFATGCSPAVADGGVFIASGLGRVYRLNESDGAQMWLLPPGYGWAPTSLTVAYGKVFYGSEYPNGKVYCLDASNGGLIWSYPTDDDWGDWIMCSPAVAGGRVFFGSGHGTVYCLDASDGSEIWIQPTGEAMSGSSPAVADGKVFVGSRNDLYCLDASNGDVIWTYPIYTMHSSPAVANGNLFAGGHTLYCFASPLTRPTERRTRLDVMVYSWSTEVDEALVGAVVEFESDPSVRIDLIREPPETYSEKLLVRLAAGGRLPDVLWIDQGMIDSLRGHIIDLCSVVAVQPELIEGIPDQVLDRFRYNGHLYGIPLGTEGEFALYAYAISSRAKAYWATELILLLRNRIPPG